jgi:hypothetical protein
MKLPQETPFQKYSQESEASYLNKESINEYFEICKKDLLQEDKAEPEEDKMNGEKGNNMENDMSYNSHDDSTVEDTRNDFIDNNYWGVGYDKIDISDIS